MQGKNKICLLFRLFSDILSTGQSEKRTMAHGGWQKLIRFEGKPADCRIKLAFVQNLQFLLRKQFV